MSEMLNYYKEQSPISDPKELGYLFDAIPDDVLSIAKTVQGLITHYMADTFIYDYQYPQERMGEIDTRYVHSMLERLIAMDDSPLNEARAFDNRLIGCCRDYATLFTSILRHKGIPCRVRYGYAAYFEADFYCDHVIGEYWNGDRWVLHDPQLSETYINKMNLQFDVADVTSKDFLIGGQAWQMCRAGKADPDKFGVNSGMDFPRGWSFLAQHILQDIASQNQREMLCWEAWSYALEEGEYSDESLKRLDELAALSLRYDEDSWKEIQAVYETDSAISVPNPVLCFSPVRYGQPQPVELVLD